MAGALRGEVWLADLGPPAGRELAMARPVVIVKADRVDTQNLTIVVPLTSQLRFRNPPLTVDIPMREGGLGRDSLALCHNIRVLDIEKLSRRIGILGLPYLDRIERGLAILLGFAA